MYGVSQPEDTLHKHLSMVESLKSHLWLNCNRQSVQIRMPQLDPINIHTYIDITVYMEHRRENTHLPWILLCFIYSTFVAIQRRLSDL